MSNTMQLTEKNLMVGDWLNYRISDEKWKPMQAGIDTLKGLISFKEEMNERVRPIPLTEDVLSKIEGVECDYKSTIHSVYSIKNGMSFVFLYNNGDSYLQFYGKNMKIKYLHQLQQLCRCLGHELVINF